MISTVGKEGGYSCGSGLCVVVAEFGNWQQPFPVVLLIFAVYLEILVQGGIGPFHLSVRLRVEGCTEVALYPECFRYLFPEVVGE